MNSLKSLQRDWSRWIGVLDRYAEGTPWSEPLSATAYVRLHSSLRKGLQRAFRECRGERLEAMQRMEELSAPWISLDSVRRAHKHILGSVVAQSLELQSRAFGQSLAAQRLVRLSISFFVAASVGVVVGPAVADRMTGARVLNRWEDVWRRSVAALREMDSSYWLAAAAAAVVLSGILLVRSARRY